MLVYVTPIYVNGKKRDATQLRDWPAIEARMTVEPVANQKAGRFTRVARLWSPDFRGGEPPTSDLYDPELVSMDEHCMQLRGYNVVKTADGRHELHGQRWIVRITDLFGGGFFNPGR